MTDSRTRALTSLDGLSVGDALGMHLLKKPIYIADRWIPATGPWRWTDDTHMALSVVEVLLARGFVDADDLARRFSERFMEQPRRGYGFGARELLRSVHAGADWRQAAPALFNGSGSYGNGGAMRAGPIGAYFAGDHSRAAAEARTNAAITHTHPEAQEGAAAVAVAASLAASVPGCTGSAFIEQVAGHIAEGEVRRRLGLAQSIPADDTTRAISELGTGREISAVDTVPFCVWVAAHNLHDFESAIWTTADGGDDGDTTGAIVGSIVSLSADIPQPWLDAREPLEQVE